MSFARPTLTELVARISADFVAWLPGADSLLRRSVLWVLAKVLGAQFHAAYGYLDHSADLLPDTKRVDILARWCVVFGIARKAATPAAGTATATGTNGTDIVAGTVLVRADGARYLVQEDVTVAGGTATLAIEAEDAGAAGAMATGQPLTFVSPIAGVAAIATVAAPGLTGGADEESDASLQARLLDRLRNPPAGGNRADYARWAKEVPEVTRAWVEPNWAGLGTVRVLFVMDGREDIIPASGDIDAVEAYLGERRPVTADLTVDAPVADPLALSIDIEPNTPAVRAAVTASLRDLIAREAEPGGTIPLSHIGEAISIAAGEASHTLISPMANVTADPGEITTLGAITWS